MKTILMLALVLMAGPAFAQGEVGKTYALKGNGGLHIIIWRSESAADSGMALIRGGQPDLATRYIVCSVPPGTRVLVMPMPYAHSMDNTRRVTVVAGKSRGCEGSVYSWDIYGNLKEREADAKKWWEEREQMARAAEEKHRKTLAELSTRRECQTLAFAKRPLPDIYDDIDDCMEKRGFDVDPRLRAERNKLRASMECERETLMEVNPQRRAESTDACMVRRGFPR